jgi:hypothetical protein
MAKTTFLDITYPDENANPFYNAYKQQMESMSRILFQAKLQAQMIMGGGGTVTFNAGTNTLSWTQDFVIPVYYYGYKLNVVFGPDFATRQAVLSDGNALYIEVPFVLTGNKNINFSVGNAINKENHQLLVVGFRSGSKVYLNGLGVIG